MVEVALITRVGGRYVMSEPDHDTAVVDEFFVRESRNPGPVEWSVIGEIGRDALAFKIAFPVQRLAIEEPVAGDESDLHRFNPRGTYQTDPGAPIFGDVLDGMSPTMKRIGTSWSKDRTIANRSTVRDRMEPPRRPGLLPAATSQKR
jgi:hypothetical protein